MARATEQWAWEQFGGTETGDIRRLRRLIVMARGAATSPDGQVARVFADRRDREGAYDWLESGHVSAPQLMASMAGATARAARAHRQVYVAVDGSSLTVASGQRGRAFGAIGSHTMKGRGVKVMSALVMGTDGCTIGLGSQIWWTRRQRKRLPDCRRRPLADKESRHWLRVIDDCRDALHRGAPDTQPCFVLDREGDNQSVLMHAAKHGLNIIVRARHNRRLVSRDEPRRRWRSRGAPMLNDWVERQPVAGSYVARLHEHQAKPPRHVRLAVRFGKVTLHTQEQHTSRLLEPVNIYVVDVRETTSKGRCPGLHWRLLTTRPVRDLEDAKQIIFGYTLRWRIEQFHRTWKTGTCNVEGNQLRSVSALTTWATILAAVATRVERIKHLSRKEPERPAVDGFSEPEIQALRLIRRQQRPNEPVPAIANISVECATMWLADLGGYMQSNFRERPPGSVVLSRGLERLQVYVDAFALAGVTHVESLDKK
jgi:hypothetical protein